MRSEEAISLGLLGRGAQRHGAGIGSRDKREKGRKEEDETSKGGEPSLTSSYRSFSIGVNILHGGHQCACGAVGIRIWRACPVYQMCEDVRNRREQKGRGGGRGSGWGIKMAAGAHAEVECDQLALEGGGIDRVALAILEILQNIRHCMGESSEPLKMIFKIRWEGLFGPVRNRH